MSSFSDTRLGLVQPLKCGPDLLGEVCGGGGPSVAAEGLRGARAREARAGPAGEDARAGVGAVAGQARAPVHEHGAGAAQEVALPAASENTNRDDDDKPSVVHARSVARSFFFLARLVSRSLRVHYLAKVISISILHCHQPSFALRDSLA